MSVREISILLICILASISVIGLIIMLLWNTLIPRIFGLISINFWQATGLFFLVRILFGGFGHRRGKSYKHHVKSRLYQRNFLHEKWMNMTPEERQDLINRRRDYMHGHAAGMGGFFNHGEHFHKTDDKKESDDK